MKIKSLTVFESVNLLNKEEESKGDTFYLNVNVEKYKCSLRRPITTSKKMTLMLIKRLKMVELN